MTHRKPRQSAALVAVVLLGTFSLSGSSLLQGQAGCSARDPREPSVASRAQDLTKRAEVRLIVAGDTGFPDRDEVASAIASLCSMPNPSCDLGILLGDNFYLGRGRHGPARADSPEFDRLFHHRFSGLPDGFDFWAVLGNHGYETGGNPEAQIEHTYLARSSSGPEWLMPGHVFEVPKLPPWLQIVAADTEALRKAEDRECHREAVRQAFGEGGGWRVLAGHHPLHTKGRHGLTSFPQQRKMREILKPVLREKEVQLVLSGHEHDQQLIAAIAETPKFLQVVQGAGSDDSRRGSRFWRLANGARPLFRSKRTLGFSRLTFSMKLVLIEFYGIGSEETAVPLAAFECRRDRGDLHCSEVELGS